MAFLLILLCQMSWGEVLFAQNNLLSPRVHAFSAATYGGDVQNWCVAQDDNGLIYVANSVGVLRYDGVRWLKMPLPGNPTVRTIRFAGGRLYAGGYGEFGYFEISGTGLPVWHSLSDELSVSSFTEEIWNIEILADGRVVFQSFGRLFLHDGDELSVILPPGVMMFANAMGNQLLVPVTGSGIYSWRQDHGFTLLPGSEELGNKEVVSILQLKNGAVLVGTADKIYTLQAGILKPWSLELNEQLKSRKINRLLLLKDGTVAIGTITSGVFFFEPESGTLSHLSETSGLSNNTVLALFESSAGNLWLALDRGLDMVDLSRSVRYPFGEERPPGAVYAAIQYDGRNYLGTNQGIYWWRKITEKQGIYTLVEGTAGQVWELRKTENGLLCGHNDGTFLIRDTIATLISGRSGGWHTVPLADHQGVLLQATYTGLQLITQRQEGFETYRIPGFAAPIRYLSQIGRREFLAVHGSRGAFRLQFSEDYQSLAKIDTIEHPALNKAGLEQFNDTLLLQSQEGVYRYDAGKLVRLDTFRGIPLVPGDYCLAGQRPGEWFFCQPDRVAVYRGSTKVVDLPLRLRFPYPIVIPWANNDYLFLLDEGYAQVKVSSDERPVPRLLLRLDRLPGVGNDDVPVPEKMPVLSYAENDLAFSFALPAFDRPVLYRSRLIGYGAGEWSAWSASGKKEFTSLPAGEYTFEVAANWYEATARQRFEILPPWYLSRLAGIVYVLALLGFGRWLYSLHERRLTRQASKLEVVRQRELQRQRILGRNRELSADVRRKSEELANTTLALAKKNEMLLALKEELAKGKRNPSGSIDHRKVDKLIDRNLNNEEDWVIFESHFNEVHEAFLKRLRKAHPELTTGDLKLAAYLRMDLSSKEIAPLLHISVRGVENKRYRLRKKLELEGGDDLNRYLLEF